MNNRGFTLLELTVAVGIVGVLTVTASSAYVHYVPKAQFSESMKMMDTEAVNVLSANTLGLCTATGTEQIFKGKYGELTVAGTYKKNTGQSCPSGCNLTYKFNTTEVNNQLAGKVVAANITTAGKISKTSDTNVPDSFIPANFQSIPVSSDDNCASLTDGPLTSTPGNLTGSELATDAIKPIDPITPTDPSGEIEGVPSSDAIIIPDDIVFANEGGYKARNTENLYSLYVKKKGTPSKAVNVEFIVPAHLAVIGRDTATPAIEVGTSWPSGSKLTLTNKGIVSGRGGGGAATPHWKRNPRMTSGENGGHGIVNTSNTSLTVMNYGTLSGGGGGGTSGLANGGGDSGGDALYFGAGGAPFGRTYTPKVNWILHEDAYESSRYAYWDSDTSRWINPEWHWQHGKESPNNLGTYGKLFQTEPAYNGSDTAGEGGWMGETAASRNQFGKLVKEPNYIPVKSGIYNIVPGMAGYAYKGNVSVINKDNGQIKGLRP